MRRALLITALVAAGPLVAACGSNQPEPPVRIPIPKQRFAPQADRNFFGVNGTQVRALAANPGKHALLDWNVTAISDAGLSWVRAGVDWSTIEPFPPRGKSHRFDFSQYDPWVEALARRNLTWQPILFHPPDWATDPTRRAGCRPLDHATPPLRPGDFAAFASGFAKRYGARGSFWSEHRDVQRHPVHDFEIWNEPNLTSFWCPVIEPAVYAGLYLAARDAIHKVDPSARVIVGGLAFQAGAGSARQVSVTQPATLGVAPFLRAMLTAQPSLRRKVDVVGVHAYANDPKQLFKSIALDRELMRQVGLGQVPMQFSESGWYTHGPSSFLQPIDDQQRGRNFQELVRGISRTDCNLIGFAAQTWRTAEKDKNNLEDWWGLAAVNGDMNVAGRGYRDAVWEMRGRGSVPPPRAKLQSC